MKKIIVLAGGLMIMIAACKKDKTEPAATTTTPATTTPTPTVTPTPAMVTYDADVKAIITAKCATPSCHVAGHESPNLTTYASVKSNIATILNRMQQSATGPLFMPQGGTKVQADIDKINQWKTDGLLEN